MASYQGRNSTPFLNSFYSRKHRHFFWDIIQIFTNNWISFDFIEKQALDPNFYRVRVYIKSDEMRQVINFNPINFLDITIHSI